LPAVVLLVLFLSAGITVDAGTHWIGIAGPVELIDRLIADGQLNSMSDGDETDEQ
jgi:hypothetical protein